MKKWIFLCGFFPFLLWPKGEAKNSLTTLQDTALRVVELGEVEILSPIKERGGAREQPNSITTLSKQRQGGGEIHTIKEVSAWVPNLHIPDYGSRLTSAIYIRGIGSRINSSAVGMYVDEMPFADKSAFDFNFYDVERMEILRGPQGTLYGRNTMGGLLKIYTKNPLFYQGTDIHLGIASKDKHHSLSLSHYHKINDKIAFSFGGYYEGGDGFFRNSFLNKKVDFIHGGGGRVRLLYKASREWKFDFSIHYDYSDEGAYPYYYTGTLLGEELYPQCVGRITHNHENRYRRGMLNVGWNAEYQTDTWKLNAVTSYQNLVDRMFMDQDFLSTNIYTMEQRQRINTLSEEVVVRSKGEEFWERVCGLFVMYQWLKTDAPVVFYDEGIRFLEKNINGNMPDLASIPMMAQMGFSSMETYFRDAQMNLGGTFQTPTLNVALFHQSTLHLMDQLSATIGFRLDYERTKLDYLSPAFTNYGFRIGNSRGPTMSMDLNTLTSQFLLQGKESKDNFKCLPKIALKYDFSKGNNLYLSASVGKRSGGYNIQMFSDLLQEALSADMMQGIKGGIREYFQNIPQMPTQIKEMVLGMIEKNMPSFSIPEVSRVVYKPEYSWNFELGAHTTLFESRFWADASLFYNLTRDQQIAKFAPSGMGRMMVNAGKGESYGAEISLKWTPFQGFTLWGNYGYTHATFREYDAGNGLDYSKNYIPFVPRHTLFGEVAYKWLWGNSWLKSLTLGVNYTGMGKIYFTESNDVSQSFYALLGAKVEVECKGITLSLWGKNLGDASYRTFYFESMNRGFEQRGKPFQLGVEIRAKF